jgi:hypothetical protein
LAAVTSVLAFGISAPSVQISLPDGFCVAKERWDTKNKKNYRGKDQQDINRKYYRGKKIFHIYNLIIINIRLMAILKYDNIIFLRITRAKKLRNRWIIQQYSLTSRTKIKSISIFSTISMIIETNQEDVVIHFHGLNSEFAQ